MTTSTSENRGRSGTPALPSQLAIQRWFNRTYSDKGLTYLRPAEFYSIFMEYLGVRSGQHLLDIGCGPGLLLGQAVERGASAWGIDVSQTALNLARQQVPTARVQVSNAESLPFATDSFDHITCIGTFEHFLDGDQALAEMRRVLKASGRICMMVPNSRTLKWQIEGELLRVHDPESNERAATFEQWWEIFLRNRFTIDQIHRDEWPAYQRRRRFGRGREGFAISGQRARHLLPLRFANQFVFLLRP